MGVQAYAGAVKALILSALGFLVITHESFADSQAEQELARLSEQHDKALAAATEPINQLYRSALEQLLQKATRPTTPNSVGKLRLPLPESNLARDHRKESPQRRTS
jgi:hypothetical protein